ncbi:hypothetical protein [Hamadaea tsunoensis]|uniref:hypothetical protein n=1 Tax=Hamadaea tsunoensis TaxID=53368 RepID=UPI000417D587|nr:hypothetical protein [Hamadaea tsunoensis]
MSRRVRLRPGVHAAPVPGGLSIAGLGRTTVVAADPAEWDALFPRLHAGSPVGPSTLVDRLEELGLLLDPGDRPAEADRFPRVLSYLEAHAVSPYDSFRRLRSAVAYFPGGDGLVLDAVRRTLEQAGVGRLVATDPRPDASIVITVDTSEPPDAPWIGIWLAGEHALVGATLPDALRRIRFEVDRAPVSPVVATLAGNLAGLAALRVIAGLDDPAARRDVQLIRTDGLKVTAHPTAAVAAEWAELPADFAVDAFVPLYPGAVPPVPIACDPVTGALPAPMLVPADGSTAAVASCGVAYGAGPDPAAALRRAFVAAARTLVPLPDNDSVAAAGTSPAEFWRDAVLRCIARWEESGRLDRLAAITGLHPRTPVPEAEVVTYRVAGGRDVFATTVRIGGRLAALDCSLDAQSSVDGATAHALLAPGVAVDYAVPRDPGEFDARALLGDDVTGRWWRGEPLLDDDVLTGVVAFRKDLP